MTISKRSYQEERLQGSQEPSVRIAPEYDSSDGPDAELILRSGGLILDPWQAEIIFDWMAISPLGKWICKTCGGSVPRQNGKTGLLEGRAEAGMLMYNEQVIYTAHLQKTATETFEEMASFFDTPKLRKHIKDIKTALGREQIILNSGARVKYLARTRNGGRGQHGDLLIFDEAQELSVEAQASFIPAISASINPQVIYAGTPPDPTADGTVFRGIRDKARSGDTKSTAWFEYSVENIGDVHDRKRWAKTNPALGRRILEATIEGECEQMPPDTFARERLGWWTPVVEHEIEYAIKQDVWDACRSEDPKPEGKTAYGVKFSADGSTVALCGAVIPESGPARISLIQLKPTGYGISWLSDWLNERYQKASCVVIDGRNGVDVLVERIADTWKMKGSVIRPSSKDMIAAVGTLTNALNEKAVTWFYQQEALRESAITSVKRPIGGGWGFGGDNSAPIEAAALALWGAQNSKRNPGKKMRIG
jgi:hypothetical protein